MEDEPKTNITKKEQITKPEDIEVASQIDNEIVLTEEDKIKSKLQESIKEIIDNHPDRREYSIEDAEIEKPLTHFSYVNNLFQILRFGIHSKNFENRAKALDPEDKKLDELLLRMKTPGMATCGYQGCDSISLNTFEPNGLPNSWQLGQFKKVLFLVNPEIESWGINPEDRGDRNGQGNAIKEKLSVGDYRIGNGAAGEDEVLAVNIIKPADIRAVLMPDERFVSVLNDIRETLLDAMKKYLLGRRYREDIDEIKQTIFSDLWVMTDTLGNEKLTKEVKTIWDEIDGTEDEEALANVLRLQDAVLSSFVDGEEISEKNLRIAISRKFEINLITKA